MNISDISELQKIILRSAARRKMPGMMIPVYRVLGRVRRFVSGRILEPSEIMDTLKPFELHLEKLGYVQWILIVFDNFLNFHFGQCRALEMAEALKQNTTDHLGHITGWQIYHALHDPEADIPLARYNTPKYRVIRAREPLGVDVYVHEIVAELYYRPVVPAGITVERLKSDIGPGRFQSAMSALHRACTELEKQGLAIVVQKHSNRPGIILTPEGHSVAEGI